MNKISYLVLLMGFFAAATAQASQAELNKLRSTVDAALDALYGECCADLPKEEKRVKVRSILEKNYDLSVIIRRAIGRNWSELNESQQEQVLDLVKQLIVKAYVDGMKDQTRPEVEFGEVIEITDKRMEIPSTVDLGDKQVNVLYRLGRLKSGWQIYDVVAEDISVVSNYRQQIDDHFRKGDAEGLITKLKELLTKDEIDEDIAI
ncbi:MAG TPA: ABC transporter substrate-binding protein [Opitutales bacterium]|nr:ABC transporter substrate-binding protein [Opitutales bacterium]